MKYLNSIYLYLNIYGSNNEDSFGAWPKLEPTLSRYSILGILFLFMASKSDIDYSGNVKIELEKQEYKQKEIISILKIL